MRRTYDELQRGQKMFSYNQARRLKWENRNRILSHKEIETWLTKKFTEVDRFIKDVEMVEGVIERKESESAKTFF